jgi:hypothetical protein
MSQRRAGQESFVRFPSPGEAFFGAYSSWPGKSAKRVFPLDDPAIHVLLEAIKKDVDARHKAGQARA